MLFTLINAAGVAFFARINSGLTVIKIALPLIFAAVVLATRFEPGNFTAAAGGGGGFMPYGWTGVFAAVSTGGVAFAYIGFRHTIDLAGETRNPQRTIPWALILSLATCLAIYLLVQVSFVGGLSAEALTGGWNQLDLAHGLGPLAALTSALGIIWLLSIVRAGAVLCPFGGALVAVGSNARLAFALAGTGFLWRPLLTISGRGVPLAALVLNFVVSAGAMALFSFTELVALNSAAVVFSLAAGPVAVVALRHLAPDAPRLFRLPGGSLTAAAAFVMAALLILWSGWDTLWRLGIVNAAGLVLLVLRARGGAMGDLA
jgi:amino acid transporter